MLKTKFTRTKILNYLCGRFSNMDEINPKIKLQSINNKNVNISIRAAFAADIPEVLSLIKELAEFEKAPEAVSITADDLTRDGFGEKPLFKVFIAEIDNEVAGMALIYTGYSTWKGKLLYLDDIIVRERHRSKGIGKLLLDRVIQFAAKENARVLKWQVLRWNKDAIRFYKRFEHVVFDDEWVDCKLYQSELQARNSVLDKLI